ncbi:tumor necrosis factor receptor superfamily member 21 [Ictalurus furcatus]|uniref:tumor necrosis factor receptor superfamily member 21 n=1 Tax=Ictalurus furcatus TaxID=66913 RepID=UPI0023502EA6|nr:tumor necrosis factor receptor superfamily member 21 [Ictalurus furcatus]
MKNRSSLPWLVLSLLFSAIPPAKPGPCPTCESGYRRVSGGCKCEPCKAEYFWSLRNGQGICNMCTTSCTAKKNLIQVHPCNQTTDRRCQCKPGYYCPSPVNLTCRRDCEPCTNGFTSTSNLQTSCQQFTDCASLGKVVIEEGSPTADRVCGHPKIHSTQAVNWPISPNQVSEISTVLPKLNPTSATPDTPNTTTQTLPSSILKPNSTRAVNNSVHTVYQVSQNLDRSLSFETTAPLGVSADFRMTRETKGPVPPSEPLSKTTWIFLLLLLVSLCLVTCVSLKCKSRAIKNKLEWAGLAFERYQPVLPTAHPNPPVDIVVPVSDVTDTVREVQGQGSFPGKNQKVTMEHVGKADGINNTVGSIFIYSPGMVILGSNSNEKKEEAETGTEDIGEDTCLMSVPQQESSSEEDFVRMATQEEFGKELSIPVPATSK